MMMDLCLIIVRYIIFLHLWSDVTNTCPPGKLQHKASSCTKYLNNNRVLDESEFLT